MRFERIYLSIQHWVKVDLHVLRRGVVLLSFRVGVRSLIESFSFAV